MVIITTTATITTQRFLSQDRPCLNRVVMVECTSCDNDCGNKRFQLRQYPKLKPFLTDGRYVVWPKRVGEPTHNP